MDGKLLATDTARFATLKKLVDIDLADRREWFGRAENNRKPEYEVQTKLAATDARLDT